MPVQTRSQTRSQMLEPKVEVPQPKKVEIPEPKVEIPEPKVEIPEPKVEIPEPKVNNYKLQRLKYKQMTLNERLQTVKELVATWSASKNTIIEVVTADELKSRGATHSYFENTKYVACCNEFLSLCMLTGLKISDLYIIAPEGYWFVSCSEKITGYGYDTWLELHPIGKYGENY